MSKKVSRSAGARAGRIIEPLVHASHQALVDAILARWRATDTGGQRYLVGVAGPPAAGKSTLAERLATELTAQLTPQQAVVMGMDGFHLDDALLVPAGLRPVKGAPQTFDTAGFAHLLSRVKRGESPVYLPVFDRALELSRNAASVVDERVPLVVVEGNYLLLDRPEWSPITGLFDLTIGIEASVDELERRLLARWRGFGFDEAESRRRADANDLPNARLVTDCSRLPDILWRSA